jgi:hypothetical protein
VSYAAGTRFERKVRTDLRNNGYTVIRAAGSKGDSKVDLVALKPGQALFIQCKADGTMPPAEWDRLFDVAGWVSAYPILASNGLRGRGVRYYRLLGHKRRGAHTQLTVPFLLDQIAGGFDG